MTGLIYLIGKKLYFCNDMEIGEILLDVDGEYKIFFKDHAGYTPFYLLKAIYDLLEDMNRPYFEEIEAFFAGQLKLDL